MFPCRILTFVILTGVECHVSSSLYRAVEVGADSLATLSMRASLSMENVMLCGLSCSSRDCPGFSYSEASKLCTRLETDCVPADLLSPGQVSPVQLYIRSQLSLPCVGNSPGSTGTGVMCHSQEPSLREATTAVPTSTLWSCTCPSLAGVAR